MIPMEDDNKLSYAVRAARDYSRVSFSGTLRLQGRQEYEKIHRMLQYAAQRAGESLELFEKAIEKLSV